MNPFSNRWVAAICVLGILLVVAELVGTGDRGGVLSQMVRSDAAQDMPSSEESVEVYSPPPTVIEEVPEDDLPQMVTEDDVVDDDFIGSDDGIEIAIDLPADDEPVED